MSVVATPHRIKKLPEDLINHIAAGEVIERPASVVKELLENSLDAGADTIEVTVSGGGNRLIRVTDNGAGISEADLPIAVDRHTTSKLGTTADLVHIRTLGFRGEALSSIASVSRFTLTSCAADQQHGWQLRIDNGKPQVQPAAHPRGTTVEVRDLFYNVPARRKFLRSDHTELLHIHAIIRRIALSRDTVALRFMHDDRQLLHITPAEREPGHRAAMVYGRSFMRAACRVDYRAGGLYLYGYAGTPEQARSQTDRQYFYLNGRSIRDRQINHAVRQAYQDRLYPGRHPVYLLYLEMEHAAVDVNVHPAKQEVRFRKPRDIHDFIYAGLMDALARAPGIPGTDNNPAGPLFDHAAQPGDPPATREPVMAYPPQSTGENSPAKVMHFNDGEYLLLATGTGGVLIHVPRAREELLRCRLQDALRDGALAGRPVLVPVTFSTSERDHDWLLNNAQALNELGLQLEPLGPDTAIVRQLPVLLAAADAVALARDVIAHGQSHELSRDDSALMHLMARHGNDTPVSPGPAEAAILYRDLQTLRENGNRLPGVLRELNADAWRRILTHGA